MKSISRWFGIGIGALVVLVIVMYLSGCELNNSKTNNPNGNTSNPGVNTSSPLVGTWGDNESVGGPGDVINGDVQSTDITAKWYVFREDGTYSFITVTTGGSLGMRGHMDRRGRYEDQDGSVLLYDNKSYWYEDFDKSKLSVEEVSDRTVQYTFNDDGSLRIGETGEPNEYLYRYTRKSD
ncbi:MAG: hypothetical protein IBX64_13485 [Actinobacteria bacterium]|nr:hypothetical protein [Actinomycetota bacterium]